MTHIKIEIDMGSVLKEKMESRFWDPQGYLIADMAKARDRGLVQEGGVSGSLQPRQTHLSQDQRVV